MTNWLIAENVKELEKQTEMAFEKNQKKPMSITQVLVNQ